MWVCVWSESSQAKLSILAARCCKLHPPSLVNLQWPAKKLTSGTRDWCCLSRSRWFGSLGSVNWSKRVVKRGRQTLANISYDQNRDVLNLVPVAMAAEAYFYEKCEHSLVCSGNLISLKSRHQHRPKPLFTATGAMTAPIASGAGASGRRLDYTRWYLEENVW